MEKNLRKCPSCGAGELTRVRRNASERFMNQLTFNRYFNKKYRCYACLSEFNYSNNSLKKVIAKQAGIESTTEEKAAVKVNKLNATAILIFLLLVVSMVLTNTSIKPVQTFKAIIFNNK